MNSHDLTILVYLVFVLAGVTLQVIALTGRTRIPTFGTIVSRAMRTRSGRVGIMAGWVWLGLHFFAR
jgi:hypothetical protein